MTRTPRLAAALLATSALALTLGGCKFDNRPLLARNSPPPVEPAGTPPLGPLDPEAVPPGAAQAAYAAPAQAYAYPQRAYAMSRVVAQRPPSYAFSYGDEQPWAWDAADQGTMFAEPIDDGYRYYYYEPGQAYPYFVQDPDYGYAYGPSGALIALFGVTGALIAADHYRDYAPRAERYWSRGYDLDRVYQRSPRRPVQESIWRERGPAFVEGHDRWFRAASAQPAWRAAAAHGDNGRHLGWFKDHGGAGREVAFAPTPRFEPHGRADQGPHPDKHAWREARQDQPQRTPGRADRLPRVEHGPPAREAHGPTQAREAHGGGRHGGGEHGGGDLGGVRAFARTAEPHGGGPSHTQHGPPGDGDRGHGGGNHGGGDHGGGQAFARAPQPHGGGDGGHGGGNHGGGGGGGGGDHGGGGHGGGADHGGGGNGHGGGGGGGNGHGGGGGKGDHGK